MCIKLGFAFSFHPGGQERYALMLSRSIRLFAGKQKNAPIFAMIPYNEEYLLQPDTVTGLKTLNVELIPYDMFIADSEVYYASKTIAAGCAEAYARGKVEQLIYTDVDSLILNDPSIMALGKNQSLGIRPVDIRNIGLSWEEPIDEFWSNIYSLLKVPASHIFPVISSVDSTKLRAYFNACSITVKPEFGLLAKWSQNFARLYNNPVWKPFLEQSELYKIFLHQAIMVGTMLAELSEEDFEIYPIQINFPLYSYPNHPHKPQWINELVSCRLDLLQTRDNWKEWLPIREPLKSWFLHNMDELKLDA